MCHRRRSKRHRSQGYEVVVLIAFAALLVVAPPLLQSATVVVVAVNDNFPALSVKSSRSVGIKKSIDKRQLSKSSAELVGEEGGITLGDLDQMKKAEGNQSNTLFPNTSLGFNNNAQTNTQQQRQQQQWENQSPESSSLSNSQLNLKNHRTQHLQRIHLDLSGRVLSHILSPPNNRHHHDTRETIPLFTLPWKKSSHSTENNHNPVVSSQKNEEELQRKRHIKINSLQRCIPHLYFGAYYDLDEVWYGATRWISKCSWGPFGIAENSNSISEITETNSILGGGGEEKDVSPSRAALVTDQAWHSLKNIPRLVFPSSSSSPSLSSSPSSSSSWIFDMEGERSVFDGTDSTFRIRLIQSQPSTSITNDNKQQTATINTISPRKISFEYDSAKYYGYYDDDNKDINTSKRRKLQYSPTLSMIIQTPFLHRRIELHAKKTWIIKEGGDKHGNYYGGDYYTSESNAAKRRLKNIKERYKDGIPKSTSIPSLTRTITDNRISVLSRLSNWLDNDGWMPRRVTTNLMGNLVSVSEVGLRDDNRNKYHNDQTDGSAAAAAAAAADADADADADDVGAAVCMNAIHKTRSWHTIIPPIHNAGIRLRVSKTIDWTTLGIFPWSNNNSNDTNSRGWTEALQSTLVRLELCGLHGIEEENCASVGLEVDPLDWNGSFKFTVGQEGVTILGSQDK